MNDKPYIVLHGGRFGGKRVRDDEIAIRDGDRIRISSVRIGIEFYQVGVAGDARVVGGRERVAGRSWSIDEEELLA